MIDEDLMKVQLVAVLSLSNDVEAEADPIGRKLALEHMQRAIQSAAPMIRHYAADLMVSE